MEAALTLAAIFALSCTGKPTSTSSTNVTPGSAVVAPVDAATSNRVTDRKTAEANLGQAVEVHGTARNAKLAAAVALLAVALAVGVGRVDAGPLSPEGWAGLASIRQAATRGAEEASWSTAPH